MERPTPNNAKIERNSGHRNLVVKGGHEWPWSLHIHPRGRWRPRRLFLTNSQAMAFAQAELMKQVWDVDVLKCDCCGGRCAFFARSMPRRRLGHKARPSSGTHRALRHKGAKDSNSFAQSWATMARSAGMNGGMGKRKGHLRCQILKIADDDCKSCRLFHFSAALRRKRVRRSGSEAKSAGRAVSTSPIRCRVRPRTWR